MELSRPGSEKWAAYRLTCVTWDPRAASTATAVSGMQHEIQWDKKGVTSSTRSDGQTDVEATTRDRLHDENMRAENTHHTLQHYNSSITIKGTHA